MNSADPGPTDAMQVSKAILAASACAITAVALVEAGKLNDPAQAGTAMIGGGGVITITSSVGQGPVARRTGRGGPVARSDRRAPPGER